MTSDEAVQRTTPASPVRGAMPRGQAAGPHAEGPSTDALPGPEQAAPLAPTHSPTLSRLATAYHPCGQRLEALRVCDRIIGLGRADAGVWRQTAELLCEVGEYAQAIGAYQSSLRMEPASAESHHGLALALYRLGDIECAAAHLHEATRLGESLATSLNLAILAPGLPEATHGDVLSLRRAFAKKLAAETEPLLPRARSRSPGPQRTPLRVAYVSAAFDRPNYMKPVWGLINEHDRAAIQVHLFSDSPPERGTPGYEPRAGDRLHSVGHLTNPQLAALIAREGIDILVDLNAYSAPDRLGLYLAPPAPVTLAWFNLYATSALPGIQHIIGDNEVVRPAEEPFYTEEVIRLPVSYLTFAVQHPVPPVGPPPCTANGFLTFGSLVAQYKINGRVLDTWCAILRRAATARMLLANSTLGSPQNRQYVLDQFTHRGIDQDRITLLGPAEHCAYLAYYDQVDVALDAFPYNGGTTTMEAIWQGVPVITFDGDRWAARTSQSLLRRTHMAEFVAPDLAGYLDLATALASSPETPARLVELRATTRERLRTSSACDCATLARAMESLYTRLARAALTSPPLPDSQAK